MDEHFKDFDTDLTKEEDSCAPRIIRARKRKETERKVYTIAGIAAVVLLLLLIVAARSLRRRVPEGAIDAQAAENEEASLTVTAPAATDAAGESLDPVLEETITSILAKMSLEEKVAGLFVITPEQLTGVEAAVSAGTQTRQALAQYPVCGLIYDAKNLKSKEQVQEMLAGVSGMSAYPLFLAVNENGTKRSAAAEALGETVYASGAAVKEASAAKASAEAVGTYLSVNGFTMNLAPIANLLPAEGESALDGFAYSQDAALTAQIVAASVEGFQTHGTSTCVKYFPAYGEETLRTAAEMAAEEFLPFTAAIEAGCDAIMMSNIKATALTGEAVPCSLSYTAVTTLLREQLKFQGIVFTDAMNMEAVTQGMTSKETAVAAINAGVDVLFLPLDFTASYEGLLEAVQSGEISEARIDESLRRIFRVKYKNGV